jgi:hypothetical protein
MGLQIVDLKRDRLLNDLFMLYRVRDLKEGLKTVERAIAKL